MQGGFGVIVKTKDLVDKNVYAVKIISPRKKLVSFFSMNSELLCVSSYETFFLVQLLCSERIKNFLE